jgi:hypothetical protein
MSLVVEPPDWAVILSAEEKHLMEYQGVEYSVVQLLEDGGCRFSIREIVNSARAGAYS